MPELNNTTTAMKPREEPLPERFHCRGCGHNQESSEGQLGWVRGNTSQFNQQNFPLWRCPHCATIHAVGAVDFEEIYRNYPLNERRLDAFAVATLGNLLKRLIAGGLRKSHRILDYGCGSGLFVTYLREQGYWRVSGYDPYVPAFASLPEDSDGFDWIIANDVIEHCDDPSEILAHCCSLLRSGGHLYVGMPDAAGVKDMSDLETHVTRLHQPFHRVIMTQPTLEKLAGETGFDLCRRYRRSYMDTLKPFANYRFLDELCLSVDHDMDRALRPIEAARAVLTHPRLWFFAVGGYFLPSADEPASIWEKR